MTKQPPKALVPPIFVSPESRRELELILLGACSSVELRKAIHASVKAGDISSWLSPFIEAIAQAKSSTLVPWLAQRAVVVGTDEPIITAILRTLREDQRRREMLRDIESLNLSARVQTSEELAAELRRILQAIETNDSPAPPQSSKKAVKK